MKKYTIIFSESWMTGSHRNSVTRFDRVETDDLRRLLKKEYVGNAWFVFEGWPRLEGEDTVPVEAD